MPWISQFTPFIWSSLHYSLHICGSNVGHVGHPGHMFWVKWVTWVVWATGLEKLSKSVFGATGILGQVFGPLANSNG